MGEFFDRVIVNGEKANDVHKEISNRENINIKPEISTYPKEGVEGHDKNGNHIRVFPDGSFEILSK